MMESLHGLYRTPFDLPRPLPPVATVDDFVGLPRADRIAHVQRIRVAHSKYVCLREDCEAVHELSRAARRPGCLVIFGHSRCGKTTLAEEFSATHPPTITSSGPNRIRILSVTVPPFPSKKALPEQFLYALGDPYWYRGSAAQMTQRILKLLDDCGVEMVFLDETQHLVDMTGLATEIESTIFLMQLVSKVNIPFVALGLERCLGLFRGNEMLRARFKTALPFAQYDFGRQADASEWANFLEAFVSKLPLRNMPDFASRKLARKVWYASLGLPGHAANIFAEATDLVVRKTKTQDTLTMEILSEAFTRTAWQEITDLENPFEKGSTVEGSSLPPIKTDYTAFIENRAYWKRTRDEQIALTSALKNRRH